MSIIVPKALSKISFFMPPCQIKKCISIQDFVDAYMKEMHNSDSGLTKDDLIGICLDFFEAGGETVGSTLSWLFMFMALNPKVQDRCYAELTSKLGK